MRDERGSLESHSALAGRDDPANSSFYRREQKSQEMKGPSEAPQKAETSQDWNQVPPALPVCSPTPPEVAWGTPRPRSTSPLPGTRCPWKKHRDAAGGQKSRQRLEPRTSLGYSSWSSSPWQGLWNRSLFLLIQKVQTKPCFLKAEKAAAMKTMNSFCLVFGMAFLRYKSPI